ncbi:hypothetical protein D479_13138 [Halobacillus sp. BAB-2008]|nr:hypothetical protein D479_13138 [Halobacillus sp. BAB-2008]
MKIGGIVLKKPIVFLSVSMLLCIGLFVINHFPGNKEPWWTIMLLGAALTGLLSAYFREKKENKGEMYKLHPLNNVRIQGISISRN